MTTQRVAVVSPAWQRDPEVAAAIQQEIHRLQTTLNLIASENYPSRAVLEATATALTTKYAEGYPGRRYYGGCQFVDVAENLAIERARRLFGAEHANVQPHSGTQANMAAYFALLKPGDVVLGMRLDQGGHLSHGSPINFSGRLYRFVAYGVDRETETVDFAEVERLGKEHRPKVIVAGYTAYPRTIDFPRFRRIADEVGAVLMVDMAHIAGLVAGGAHPSPVPHAQVVTATTHKTLRGPRGAFVLCQGHLAQDIDKAVFPMTQGGPFMNTIAAKAICFGEALEPGFRQYAARVVENARTLARALGAHGLRIVAGGTDNHQVLLDLTSLNLTGKDGEEALGRAGIHANRNTIPYDPRPPRLGSGLRLGTSCVTSQGMGPQEMEHIAEMMVRVLHQPQDASLAEQTRSEAQELATAFPVPGIGREAGYPFD